MSAPLRVIQVATGNVGVHSLRALIQNPNFELVGVHASSPNKVGQDAATLCGLDHPTGVIATNDMAELVALHADCVVYTGRAEARPMEAIEEITAFLRAGTNVVASSLVWLIYPPHADSWLVDPLQQACEQGGTTMYVNGIDPGFSGDVLAFAALALTTHAETITVQEVFDYATYDDGEFTGATFGFGQPPEHTPLLFLPGVLTGIWGGTVRLLADRLGVPLDEIRERYEQWVSPHLIDCAMARVEPGTVGAVRFSVDGVVDGEVRISMEHINRLGPTAAPDWDVPPDGRLGVHRVVVTGDPGVEINTHLGMGTVDHNTAGVIATAARVVNAIPAVCAHRAGLISTVDLPIDTLPPLGPRP